MDRVIIELDLSLLSASPRKTCCQSLAPTHDDGEVISSGLTDPLLTSSLVNSPSPHSPSTRPTCSLVPDVMNSSTAIAQSTCSPSVSQTVDSPTAPISSPSRSSQGLLVDTFRALHPERTGAYTNWCTVTGARATNYGRRLDYILADPRLVMVSLNKAEIRPEVQGSDHCPVLASFLCATIPAKKCPSLCTKYLPEFTGRQQKLSSFLRVFKRVDNGSAGDEKRGVIVELGNGNTVVEAMSEDGGDKTISELGSTVLASMNENVRGKNIELMSERNHPLRNNTNNLAKSSSKTLGKRSSSDSSKTGKKYKSEVPVKQQGNLLSFFTKKPPVADKKSVGCNGSSVGSKNVCDGSIEKLVDHCSSKNSTFRENLGHESESNIDGRCDNVLDNNCDAHTSRDYKLDVTGDNGCENTSSCDDSSVTCSIGSRDLCDSSDTLTPSSPPSTGSSNCNTALSSERIAGRNNIVTCAPSADHSVMCSPVCSTEVSKDGNLTSMLSSQDDDRSDISSHLTSASVAVQVTSASNRTTTSSSTSITSPTSKSTSCSTSNSTTNSTTNGTSNSIANSSSNNATTSTSYGSSNSVTNGRMQKSSSGSSGVGTSDGVAAAKSWKEMLKGPPQAPLCKGHKEPCVLREVKKDGPNKGKKFWVCCKPQGLKTDPAARCDHFVWISNKGS